MLEKRGAKVDKVLNFAIDDAILEERITGRWIHPSSGRTYHTKFAPPKAPGIDDVRLQIVCPISVFWFCDWYLDANLSMSNYFWFCDSCILMSL